MSQPLPRPVLTVYRRTNCHLCDDAEVLLQAALEDRARRGELNPTVRHVGIDGDADLEARYGERIPVFAIGDREAELVTSSRRLQTFLDATLPRLA